MGYIFENTRNTRPILPNSLKFIRSDVPTQVSEPEREWLLANGITTMIDLRTDEERAAKECPLAKDSRFQYVCRPVAGGSTVPPSVDAVSGSYIAMVNTALWDTIDFMMSCPTNVLYFCSAGKDRTGVVSAILLYQSGMKLENIVADYMKSKTNLSDMLTAFAKANPTVDINVITPQERYIREFLDWFIANAASH